MRSQNTASDKKASTSQSAVSRKALLEAAVSIGLSQDIASVITEAQLTHLQELHAASIAKKTVGIPRILAAQFATIKNLKNKHQILGFELGLPPQEAECSRAKDIEDLQHWINTETLQIGAPDKEFIQGQYQEIKKTNHDNAWGPDPKAKSRQFYSQDSTAFYDAATEDRKKPVSIQKISLRQQKKPGRDLFATGAESLDPTIFTIPGATDFDDEIPIPSQKSAAQRGRGIIAPNDPDATPGNVGNGKTDTGVRTITTVTDGAEEEVDDHTATPQQPNPNVTRPVMERFLNLIRDCCNFFRGGNGR